MDWNGGLEWWNCRFATLGFKGAQNLIPLYTALEGPQAASANSNSQRRAPDSSKLVPESPRWPSDGTSYLKMAPDGPHTATAGARRLQTDQDGRRLFQRGPMLLQMGPRRLSASVRWNQIATEYCPPLNPSLHHSIHCFTISVHHYSPLILVQ